MCLKWLTSPLGTGRFSDPSDPVTLIGNHYIIAVRCLEDF